jgi:hypothetical protein
MHKKNTQDRVRHFVKTFVEMVPLSHKNAPTEGLRLHLMDIILTVHSIENDLKVNPDATDACAMAYVRLSEMSGLLSYLSKEIDCAETLIESVTELLAEDARSRGQSHRQFVEAVEVARHQLQLHKSGGDTPMDASDKSA